MFTTLLCTSYSCTNNTCCCCYSETITKIIILLQYQLTKLLSRHKCAKWPHVRMVVSGNVNLSRWVVSLNKSRRTWRCDLTLADLTDLYFLPLESTPHPESGFVWKNPLRFYPEKSTWKKPEKSTRRWLFLKNSWKMTKFGDFQQIRSKILLRKSCASNSWIKYALLPQYIYVTVHLFCQR